MSERLRLVVPANEGGSRLDAFLARHVPDFSRARATEHIAMGHVQLWRGVDQLAPGKVKPSYLLHDALTVDIAVQPRPQMSAEPEAIPLVVVYEDADLLVVDKPAGLVVHPAAGHETGTLVNALLHHVPDVAEVGDDELRPGLVHRIDKDTSGLLVVSKSELAMRKWAALFARHELERRYAAVVLGGLPDPADLGKVILVAAFGPAVIAAGQQAGKFIGAVAKACGGGGGGRPNLAQAGGRDGAALDGALAQARQGLEVALG